jgi:hypothetical protein
MGPGDDPPKLTQLKTQIAVGRAEVGWRNGAVVVLAPSQEANSQTIVAERLVGEARVLVRHDL